jgi:hypothetical protein
MKLAIAAAGLLGVGAVQNAQAIPITGDISMGGGVTLDDGHLGRANKAVRFSGVTVGGGSTGSFDGTGGNSVTWKSFGWDPATTPVTPLWSFTAGALTYSFALSTVSVFSQSATLLSLTGTGILSITGAGSLYDATPGSWSFSINDSDGNENTNKKFTFSNNQTAAAVPDGGMTIMLLGMALGGLGYARRLIA